MRGHLNVVVAEEGHKGFVSWPNFFFFCLHRRMDYFCSGFSFCPLLVELRVEGTFRKFLLSRRIGRATK